MDALFSVLKPVVDLLNRQIAESTPAREICERLDGNTIAVRVRNTALSAAMTVNEGRLDLTTLEVSEPDAAITGSLLSLARLAGDAGEELIRSGQVELVGDAIVANDFRELLRYARPDVEEGLSRVVGDAAANSIGTALRSAGQWGKAARDTLRQNVGEYLQEESRSVPSRYEFDEFSADVNTLRDDIDRSAARIAALERQKGGQE